MQSHRLLQQMEDMFLPASASFKEIEYKDIFLILGEFALRTNNNFRYLSGNSKVSNFDTTKFGGYPSPTFESYVPMSAESPEGLIFCDTPILINEKQASFALRVGLDLTLRMSAKVKGLIVIFDYLDIHQSKCQAYFGAIRILGTLFGSQLNKLFQSATFVVVNKPEDQPTETAMHNFLGRLNQVATQLTEFRQNNPSNDKVIFLEEFSHLLIKHSEQIFILDPNDNGKSRAAIYEHLQKTSPVNSKDFQLDEYASDHPTQPMKPAIDEMMSHLKSRFRFFGVWDKELLEFINDVSETTKISAAKLTQWFYAEGIKLFQKEHGILYQKDIATHQETLNKQSHENTGLPTNKFPIITPQQMANYKSSGFKTMLPALLELFDETEKDTINTKYAAFVTLAVNNHAGFYQIQADITNDMHQEMQRVHKFSEDDKIDFVIKAYTARMSDSTISPAIKLDIKTQIQLMNEVKERKKQQATIATHSTAIFSPAAANDITVPNNPGLSTSHLPSTNQPAKP